MFGGMLSRLVVLFFFLLFINERVQAQHNVKVISKKEIVDTTFTWKSIEKKASKESEELLFDWLYLNTGFCFAKKNMPFDTGMRGFAKFHSSNLHFIDYTSDGSFEAVYSGYGCPGWEGGGVYIYQSRKDTIRSLFSHEGEVVGFYGDTLLIHRYPCCAETRNELLYFSLKSILDKNPKILKKVSVIEAEKGTFSFKKVGFVTDELFDVHVLDFSSQSNIPVRKQLTISGLKNASYFLTCFNSHSIPFESKDSLLTFYTEEVQVYVEIAHFDSTEHKLEYKGSKDLYEIDGKTFYGTDGGVPRFQYSSIYLKINGMKKYVPKAMIVDMYEPSFSTPRGNKHVKVPEGYCDAPAVHITKEGTIILRMDNSDGAGAYSVIWFFDKYGELVERIVSYGF